MLFSGDGVNFWGRARKNGGWQGTAAGRLLSDARRTDACQGRGAASVHFYRRPAAGWDGWCKGPWRAQPLSAPPKAASFARGSACGGRAAPAFPHPAGMGKGAAATPGAGSFDILDLAFEGIAGLFPDDALYFGDKLPHIGGGGTAPVDDKPGVLSADLGTADGKALKPALIH